MWFSKNTVLAVRNNRESNYLMVELCLQLKIMSIRTHPSPIHSLCKTVRLPFYNYDYNMEMIFHSHGNKTLFHKKGCVLGLIFEVRVFELGSGLATLYIPGKLSN